MFHGIEGWQKHARTAIDVPCTSGVYALFLRNLAPSFPSPVAAGDLLYIGRATNLGRRCHFSGSTHNHSPRKSLAVILMAELGLKPVLVRKGSSRATWGLDHQSEQRLSGWMHANLHVAFQTCVDFVQREKELIAHYQPPLNLLQCNATTERTALGLARRAVLEGLLRDDPPPQARAVRVKSAVASLPGTAVELADTYGLDPKALRQRLRTSVSWYCKPQDWTFAKTTPEWRDMVAVAQSMAK